MIFKLTEALKEAVVQALENQEEDFFVDAETSSLVSSGLVSEDEERFYPLPCWTSKEGFELREDFVHSLHNPLVQSKLEEVLHSGRGVFRNFKNELKNYPVIERRWNIFKNKNLSAFVDDWYNALREVWGLEKLEIEPEDTENVLSTDFVFSPYTNECSGLICDFLSREDEFDFVKPAAVSGAVRDLICFNFSHAFEGGNLRRGFICKTLSDDFAGCITYSSVSERTVETVFVTLFFVPQIFRGLGIGTELINMCLSDLKSQKKRWALFAFSIIPDYLEPLLIRSGFQKTEFGFLAEIR